jgi:hypothetical protein
MISRFVERLRKARRAPAEESEFGKIYLRFARQRKTR